MRTRSRARLLPRAALTAGLLLAACGEDSSRSGPPTEPGPEPEPPVQVATTVEVVIDPTRDRVAISPYVYGSNQEDGTNDWTVRRFGGNRVTGYNWENNFSNAGKDWHHNSDDFAVTNAGIPAAEATVPGVVVRRFHRESIRDGAESIVSLQMAGYVAADGAGPVSAAETAPSDRWVKVETRKPGELITDPALDDGVVYMDELVNSLVQRFGRADTETGVRWYSLDNEPALWHDTHPRIHPEPVGAAELVERSVELAAAVKDVDSSAGILGPALYGFTAYLSLQEAPDWEQVRGGHDWFIDYYLARMRQAEAEHGRRLLDVLDVHWYPEARGDSRVVDEGATTPADVEARLQAPRTLWDPTYTETSWIAEHFGDFLPILPRLRESIEENYPGTELAITEYDYGGGSTISGGLAQADVLGAFGRHGVHIATLWGIEEHEEYTSAAFQLYRDYDGSGGTFGSTSVPASASDRALASVWASTADDGALHLIVVNKNDDGPMRVDVGIRGGQSYTSGTAWGFDAGSPRIGERDAIAGIQGNAFDYVVPPLSATHIVLR